MKPYYLSLLRKVKDDLGISNNDVYLAMCGLLGAEISHFLFLLQYFESREILFLWGGQGYSGCQQEGELTEITANSSGEKNKCNSIIGTLWLDICH